MDELNGHEPLRIGFTSASESPDLSDLGQVSVPDLANVLLAYQRAVYSTAAYDLHLPGARNLTEQQRQIYTLSVVAYKQGSFWVEILPWIIAHKMQLATIIAPPVIEGLLVNAAWTGITHSISALKKVFEKDEEQDKKLTEVILPHAATIARVALNNNQKVMFTYRDPSGAEFSLETIPEKSREVLTREALEQGELEEFKDCVVRDIQTTQPIITITSPTYPHKTIPCQYERRQEQAFTHSLKVDDSITVIGWPMRPSRARKNIAPTLVKICQLRDAAGQIIVESYESRLIKGSGGGQRRP